MARPRSDIQSRVLRAARKRFLLEGVDGASLRRIASDARTSIGMIYYYFPSKDALFLAVVEEVYSVVLSDILTALDPKLPVEERIRGLYRRVGSVTNDELAVIRLVIREALISSKRLDQIFERFQRGHVPLMFELLVDGLSDGTFDSELHPVVVAVAMLALGGPGQLMHRALAPRAPFPGSPTGSALTDQMVRILLRGAGGQS